MADKSNAKSATWPDVVVRALELVSEAINKGWIFFLVLLVWLVIAMIMTIRLPPDDLGHVTVAIVDGLTGKLGFTIIILLNNVLWLWLYRNTRALFQREIDRLADERKGIITGEIETPFSDYNSSDDPDTTIITPTPPSGRGSGQ